MIKIIRTFRELERIKHDWNELLGSSDLNEVFLTHEWINIWARHFLKDKELFIICIYNDGGKMDAIVPCWKSRFFVFFNVLRFISDDFSDYLGAIVRSSGDYKMITRKILEVIKKESKTDIIYFRQVPEKFKNALSDCKIFKSKEKESGSCYYIKLPSTIDSYVGKFNSKQRYNILKRVKKAEENSISYLNSGVLPEDNPGILIERFFELHQKRWNIKGKLGVFYNDKIRSFFKDLFLAFYKSKILVLSFLKYEGNYIAGSVSFDRAGKRQVYLPGFDPSYSNFHPGIVLTYYNIREAIDKKYGEFDFLKGNEDYKKRFLGVKRKNYKIFLFRNAIVFYIYKINLFFKNEFLRKILNLRRIKKNG